MKHLLIAIALISQAAFATGKIIVQPNYYLHSKEWKPMVGLSVYEPIKKGFIAYNSFTGLGEQPLVQSPDVRWWTTKHAVEFYLGALTIAPGFQLTYVQPFNEFHNNLHVKFAVKLW